MVACPRCVHREIKENLETAKVNGVLNAHRCQRRRSTDNVVEFSKGVIQASAISPDGSSGASAGRRRRGSAHRAVREDFVWRFTRSFETVSMISPDSAGSGTTRERITDPIISASAVIAALRFAFALPPGTTLVRSAI